MDIPEPTGGDTNRGTSTFIATWVLTAIAGVALIFRYGVKTWVHARLPSISSPERIWGYEDVFFIISYSIDVVHMTFIQLGYQLGLGRHFFYLTPAQRAGAMKWQFASQSLAVSATTFSRTGMMWFLYQCFGKNNRKFQPVIVACIIVHLIVNIVTILQILLQCGPVPYRLTNRLNYFHILWDGPPADGSGACQSPTVQTTTGYVQGAFNTATDFIIAYIAAFELWQFFLNGLKRNPLSFRSQFRTLDKTTRNRRIWQTVTLCGPVILSGIASIVKTVLLGSIGERMDFTWNIVPFILWVKIENYSIIIAACAPVARTFFKIVGSNTPVNTRIDPTYGSRSHPNVPLKDLSGRTHKNGFDRMGSEENLQGSRGSVSRKEGEEASLESVGDERDGIVVTKNVVVSTTEVEAGVNARSRGNLVQQTVNGWQTKSRTMNVVEGAGRFEQHNRS